jgi:hypothetical protein
MTVDELAMQIRQMGYMLGLKSSTMVPLIDKIREMQEGLLRLRKERDEARKVMHSVVEEFVQHTQTQHPLHHPTPMHECEFSWNPECGKCDACETWSDYVRICHPHEDTEEEETP